MDISWFMDKLPGVGRGKDYWKDQIQQVGD